MRVDHQTLGPAELSQIVGNLDSALNVLRAGGNHKTPLDIYFVSVFSTLRRTLMERQSVVNQSAPVVLPPAMPAPRVAAYFASSYVPAAGLI
jgi:hypothetical protein